MAALQKQIDQATKRIEALTADQSTWVDQAKEARSNAKQAVNRAKQLAAEAAELDRLEGDDATKVFSVLLLAYRKAIVAKLRGLVGLNESLKQQELQFKATCKVASL